MTRGVCERVHSVCKRENTPQRWFPERFIAPKGKEHAALKKKTKKNQEAGTWLGFQEGLAKASGPTAQALGIT